MKKIFVLVPLFLITFCSPTSEELLTQECVKTKESLFKALDYWKDNYERDDFKNDYALYDEYRVALIDAIEKADIYKFQCEELDGYWDFHRPNNSVDFWQSRLYYFDGYWDAKETYSN